MESRLWGSLQRLELAVCRTCEVEGHYSLELAGCRTCEAEGPHSLELAGCRQAGHTKVSGSHTFWRRLVVLQDLSYKVRSRAGHTKVSGSHTFFGLVAVRAVGAVRHDLVEGGCQLTRVQRRL